MHVSLAERFETAFQLGFQSLKAPTYVRLAPDLGIFSTPPPL